MPDFGADWLYDNESGCLECGELKFRHSTLPGVCLGCYNESRYDTAGANDDFDIMIVYPPDEV